MAAANVRRPLGETRDRWKVTQTHSATFNALQTAVMQNPQASPCVLGCRSVCWKTFLLFKHVSSGQNWLQALQLARTNYSERRDTLLRYIKHPEELARASVDPLADVPDSPWNSLREDEAVRAEIEQDVRRLPDEPFYHTERIQTLILDVLFLWCKLHPKAGGYRQGMHELLAPIVFILEQDSVSRAEAAAVGMNDEDIGMMADMLDADFVEHDAYALFEQLMRAAGDFYQVDSDGQSNHGASRRTDEAGGGYIVAKSRAIHEHYLHSVDPELADHFNHIEVLPQIFLIRWIRLLFGREFHLGELLVLWDVLFAVDPTLSIVDLVCVAMLLRIRWQLVEAEYATALQLLLKYPVPKAPHHPYTFIQDAVYLQSHMNISGGSALMLKYSGRMPGIVVPSSPPAPSGPAVSRSGTPTFLSIKFRPRSAASTARPQQQHRFSHLPSATRYIQQQGGVEALFHGAARNVMERGARLGINQAVRDAMGEIKRNVQTFQERRSESYSAPEDDGDGDAATAATRRTVGMMERRNRALARLLDESISRLRALAASGLDDAAKCKEIVEAAASRMQFVQVHLEDSTIELPRTSRQSATKDSSTDDVVMDEGGEAASIIERPHPLAAVRSLSSLVMQEERHSNAIGLNTVSSSAASAGFEEQNSTGRRAVRQVDDRAVMDSNDDMDFSADTAYDKLHQTSSIDAAVMAAPSFSRSDSFAAVATATTSPSMSSLPASGFHLTKASASTSALPHPARTNSFVPMRSTLAQSSFAWMLEPDETAASTPPPSAFPAVRRSHASAGPIGGGGHRKKTSVGRHQTSSLSSSSGDVVTSRERNAFLFGEVTTVGEVGVDAGSPVRSEEIFGLQPLGGRINKT